MEISPATGGATESRVQKDEAVNNLDEEGVLMQQGCAHRVQEVNKVEDKRVAPNEAHIQVFHKGAGIANMQHVQILIPSQLPASLRGPACPASDIDSCADNACG